MTNGVQVKLSTALARAGLSALRIAMINLPDTTRSNREVVYEKSRSERSFQHGMLGIPPLICPCVPMYRHSILVFKEPAYAWSYLGVMHSGIYGKETVAQYFQWTPGVKAIFS